MTADGAGLMTRDFKNEVPARFRALSDVFRGAQDVASNPPPPIFKKRLFTPLSRSCTPRCCIARRPGLLTGEDRPEWLDASTDISSGVDRHV
ncbi:hypothetical protein [Paracoccus benzoatiresistens]|uniref:Uncharacterized protein n=1 Tax=Paracoccus benzoatiresistens TaxID=2997341 RepID=A0ABT4J9E6_9RHOB|nr:hypothetical protein [Paracoccus sp. EF6]MCZ0963754.1 hypothetical protein [Paracoccus sp. EF6]